MGKESWIKGEYKKEQERKSSITIGSHKKSETNSEVISTEQEKKLAEKSVPSAETDEQTSEEAPSAETESTGSTEAVSKGKSRFRFRIGQNKKIKEKANEKNEKEKKKEAFGKYCEIYISQYNESAERAGNIKHESITHTQGVKQRIDKERAIFKTTSDYQKSYLEGADVDKTYKKSELEKVNVAKKNAAEKIEDAEKKQKRSQAACENVMDISGKHKMKKLFKAFANLNKLPDETPDVTDLNAGAAQKKALKQIEKRKKGGFCDFVDEVRDDEVIKLADKSYDRISKVYSIMTASRDIGEASLKYMKEATTKAELAGTAFSAFAAPFALMNCLKAAVYTAVDITQYVRSWKKNGGGNVGFNEAWRVIREAISGALDVIQEGAECLGLVGTFVPIVGPILSVIGSGAGLVQSTINVLDSGARTLRLRSEKKKFWERMEEKKKKYESKKDFESAGYYNLGKDFFKSSETAIEEKRERLRDQIVEYDIAKSVIENKKSDKDLKNIKRAKKVNGKNMIGNIQVKDTKVVYGNYFTKLSSEIMDEKDKKKEDKDKRKLHMMEALDMVEKYYILNQAQKRQKKKLRDESIDMGLGLLGFAGDLTELIGEAGAAVSGGLSLSMSVIGKAASIASSGINIVKGIYSDIHEERSKKNGHLNDKKLRRNEMALTLMNSVNSVMKTEYGWQDKEETFKLDFIPDTKVFTASDNLEVFDETLTGVDINLQDLIGAESKREFMDVLSASFSQEQEVDLEDEEKK